MADDNVVTSKSIEDAEVEEPKEAAPAAEKKAPAKKAPAKKAASSKDILIKMEGPRGYASGGHDFTLEHPFKALPEKEALLLIATGSFVRAKESEVKAFYEE
ncbi:MAG: hypothetical protein CL612_03690 [Anaerolineaceae bacterium]|jgi:hypothetical protein|nr:hypothetical protein [Anaerolineaceae bacterium]MDP7088762.1 hypothetical protein [Dehalococcoidia bacterium]|tara:strand:- start:2362 stop:2667 length:306 start_codon:yes stop_codon:yes gene_type:complete